MTKTLRNKATVPASQIISPVTLTRRVRTLNRWRDTLNPVAGLKMSVARALIESYALGDFADLMWTFGAPWMGIETADADLFALIERRTSALAEMDFEIRKRKPAKDENGNVRRPLGFDPVLATEQEVALIEAYERIDNLYESIDHLCMAAFRGFSHCEKWHNASGQIYHLEIIDQWNVVRDGSRGAWKYNPDAISTTFTGLPDGNILPPETLVMRECKRSVNRIALVKFIRQNLSQKDWDAFIEIYGIPGGVVTMPPNVPQDKETEYETAAGQIAEGGSGVLPNGASYTANDGPRGTNPFRDHLRCLSEQLILCGTGGLLTMLTAPGSGTLAGNAHADTFDAIARKDARAIGEAFQRQIDKPLLAKLFPGRPHLVYFEISANESTDTGEFIGDVSALNSAGIEVDIDQVSEKTGYTLRRKAAPAPIIRNRSTSSTQSTESTQAAFQHDMAPLRAALEKALASEDPEALKKFRSELPALAESITQDPALADALHATILDELADGLTHNPDAQ